MRASSSSPFTARTIALWAGLAAVGSIAAPAACFYPSYTFNEPESAGGGGGGTPGSSSSKASSSNGMASSSNSGMGGAASSSSATGVGGSCGANNYCTTEAPSGWTGYFTLFDGPANKDPGCPAAFPQNSYTGDGGLNAPMATCSACSCGTPAGQVCTVAMFSGVGPLFVSNKTCQQQSMGGACGFSVAVVANGACDNTMALPGGQVDCADPVNNTCPVGSQACNVGAKIGPPQVAGGTCTASVQSPNKPQPMWTTFGHACGYQGPTMGCNVGQVCLPATGAPYQPGVCIQRPGDNMCPQTYPNKHVYYDSYMDTRDCTACKCGAVSGATCSATVNLYSDASCNTMIASIPAGGCGDISGNVAVSSRKVTPQFTGSCAVDPAGGQPTGAVTGQNAVTYCCK